jgi:hypothetical protein
MGGIVSRMQGVTLDRAAFIRTPHRGSEMAVSNVGELGRRLIALPVTNSAEARRECDDEGSAAPHGEIIGRGDGRACSVDARRSYRNHEGYIIAEGARTGPKTKA